MCDEIEICCGIFFAAAKGYFEEEDGISVQVVGFPAKTDLTLSGCFPLTT